MNHIKSKLALAFPFIGEAGKNLKTETNGHTNNTANSNTIETEKLYDWLGEPVTIESDKKFYKAFYKQNILYKLEDFIYFKTSEKNDQIILQIVDLYEDKTGEKWFTGLAFLKISDFKSDIHTNPHELICSHSMHSFRLINIIGKCQVRNLDTIEDVEQYEEDSNNYYYKDIKELFSSLSIQRPKKKSRRYADTMPELLLESSNNNNNKPKNRTPKKILRKREKKESGDEVSSDEERSYLKSLRRRLALETAEKRAIAEQRERIEQEYLNNTFFRSRRTVEQEEQHPQWESMLNAIVLSPSRVPKELFDDPIPVTPLPEITNNTTQQQKSELPIPEFRILTEEEYKSVNPQIDELYWKRYEEAYITTSDSIVQQMNADYEPIKKQPAVREVRKSVKLAAKFFDLDTWCEDEILFFKELLYAYGSNFKKLSNFMSSKTPEQLEEFYKRSGFDITCNVCGSTTDDEKLLVCDSCDKAYHTYCLEPPLKSIPKQLWFCDPECENSYVVKCEACRSIENLENTAKCIICNRIYHFNCIGPDVTSVPIDWKCLPCIDDELLKPDETINYEDKPIPILPEVSPEDENELKTSKKTRTIALKIADSFVPTRLSYDDIKLWADRWDAQNYDFSMLKEDNLFFIKDNVSIFSNIEISDENSDYNTHLYGILSAVDICIDRTLKNPRPKPKVVQQDPLSFLKSPKKRTTPKKKEKVKKIVSPAKTPQRRRSIETPSKKKKRIVGVNFEANMNKKRKVDETDGFGDGPKVWIFQANKQIYDIEKSIKELPVMTWFVKQHIYKIKKDDKVYVWVTGKDGGVVAKGTIMSDPSEIREHIDMKKYYLDSKFYNTVALRSFLRIDSILDHKIDKSIFIKNSLLSKTTIIRQPIGTNFKLTKQESDEIEKLIKKHAKLLPVDHSNEFSQEISNEKSTPKKSRGKKNSVKTPKKSPRKKNFAPDTPPTDIEEEEEVIVTPEKKRRRRKSTPEIPQTTVTTITTNSSTSITSTVSIVSTVSTKEDFDENSENLENLNIEILDEDSKISENINKRPKRETRNSRKLKTNAENAENSTTNSEILNNSDISKDSEISNHSSSSPIRCEICLTTTTNSTEILLCSGCDQGFHVTCIPLPEKPIESWYCNKCIDLNSKCCKLCGSAENDDQMLLCDLCDEGHHMTCLDPPLTDVPDHTWFCPSCSINSRDKEFAKLVIGYKELRIECKKILFRKCEEAHYKHHKNMTRGKSVEIVRQKLRQLANGLSETRRKLLESAILTFRVWRSSIEQQKDEIDS